MHAQPRTDSEATFRYTALGLWAFYLRPKGSCVLRHVRNRKKRLNKNRPSHHHKHHADPGSKSHPTPTSTRKLANHATSLLLPRLWAAELHGATASSISPLESVHIAFTYGRCSSVVLNTTVMHWMRGGGGGGGAGGGGPERGRGGGGRGGARRETNLLAAVRLAP